MKFKEIQDALVALNETSHKLEDAYIENEGEITEETELMEDDKEALRELLTTEGVDSLGRWLKSKEDEKSTLKAEKDYVDRRMKSVDNTIEYIKSLISLVMRECETEKVKGTLGYTFTAYTSEKTEVNKELLRETFQERIENLIKEAGLPGYIGVTLTASATKVTEGEEGADTIFNKVSTPSVRFTKPRARKE